MAASGGRKRGMDRKKTYLRQDLYDAEQKLSTIGATPHEGSKKKRTEHGIKMKR